jgi:hypothetical protein
VNQEIIAKLTGLLNFKVDASGLHKFEAELKRVEARMRAMSREADKLAKKIGLTPKASTARADIKVNHHLNRELRLEVAVQKARRATFAAELAQQKLQFAGSKQETVIASALIKQKQQEAVAGAKVHKADLERLKVQGQEIKNSATLAAAKIQQTRLESILAQQHARTQIMQQKHLQSLSATKRVELALVEARERGIRQAQRFNEQQQASKSRERRQEEAHQHRTERFAWAQQRQQHWEATRASRASGTGIDLTSFSLALGSAGVALYAFTQAASYFNERVKQRQEGANTAEQFNTSLETAGGKNPANQKRARDAFVELSNKYGQELSVENAKVYANFVQGQIAIGKTLDQAIKVYEDQSAVFRAAALDKEQAKRAAYQLGQIRSKGKPEGSDVNDLFDAIGGPVASSIRAAAAERLKFKGKPEQQAAWFKAQVTKGNILAKDFDQGMTNYLAANQDVLAKQMKSIDADQIRASNQQYMSANRLNSSQELKDVIHERIEAERQLNQAMQPLQITLTQFDIGLTKLATSMLHFAAGNNLDGSKKSDQQQTQDRMTTTDLPVNLGMVGSHDYSSVEGNTQRQGGPIGKFWNWILGVPDYRDGEANKLKVPALSPVNPVLPALDTSKFDTSQLPKRLEELMVSPMLQGLVRAGVESANRTPYANGVMKSDERTREREAPVVNNVSNSTTSNVTNSPTLNVTVNAPSSDPDQLARIIGMEVDQKLGKAFRQTNVDLNEAH